jgi:hypothetical protein
VAIESKRKKTRQYMKCSMCMFRWGAAPFRTEACTKIAKNIGRESVQMSMFCVHWLCPWGRRWFIMRLVLCKTLCFGSNYVSFELQNSLTHTLHRNTLFKAVNWIQRFTGKSISFHARQTRVPSFPVFQVSYSSPVYYQSCWNNKCMWNLVVKFQKI